jgi:rare lipoprotein A
MKNFKNLALIIMSLSFLSACSEAQYASHVIKQIPMPGDKAKSGKSAGYYKVGKPYKISGRKYYPKERFSYSQTGVASWYGPNFHGKMTANGETFNKYELTAAHKTLQMRLRIDL